MGDVRFLRIECGTLAVELSAPSDSTAQSVEAALLQQHPELFCGLRRPRLALSLGGRLLRPDERVFELFPEEQEAVLALHVDEAEPAPSAAKALPLLGYLLQDGTVVFVNERASAYRHRLPVAPSGSRVLADSRAGSAHYRSRVARWVLDALRAAGRSAEAYRRQARAALPAAAMFFRWLFILSVLSKHLSEPQQALAALLIFLYFIYRLRAFVVPQHLHALYQRAWPPTTESPLARALGRVCAAAVPFFRTLLPGHEAAGLEADGA